VNADLSHLNLSGTNFQSANLTRALLWETNLVGANLWVTILNDAILKGGKLDHAFFGAAKLYGTDLSSANISGAKALTIAQLSQVKSLFGTKLDPDLEKEVREKHPHLFEEPKKEGEGGGSSGR